MSETQKLIAEIASVELPSVFNPWKQHDVHDLCDGPARRRSRLRQHFDCKPRFLLIGEAPGYQGCHFSGVAFTSERLVCDGKIPRISHTDRITCRDKPYTEPSATVVWGALHDLGIAADAVIWNAFPWHPHRPGEMYSNRTPTRDELLAGSEILRKVVALFDGAQIVAVGGKAKHLLTWLGIWKFSTVRHPSMGGANEFRNGMAQISASPALHGESK